MEVTQEWISKLHSNLREQLEIVGDPDNVDWALACFDRATLATVLDGAGAALNPFSARAKKAAATRAKNKLKKAKEETSASTASNQESAG